MTGTHADAATPAATASVPTKLTPVIALKLPTSMPKAERAAASITPAVNREVAVPETPAASAFICIGSTSYVKSPSSIPPLSKNLRTCFSASLPAIMPTPPPSQPDGPAANTFLNFSSAGPDLKTC